MAVLVGEFYHVCSSLKLERNAPENNVYQTLRCVHIVRRVVQPVESELSNQHFRRKHGAAGVVACHTGQRKRRCCSLYVMRMWKLTK